MSLLPAKHASPVSLGPRARRLGLFGVLLLSAIVFTPSLYNGFVNWDDHDYILNNSTIRTLTPASVKEIFSSFVVGNYQPLTVLTFAVDYQMAGLSADQYHFVNIIWHVLNVYLVFRLILLLTGGYEAALLTALLFGIHPLKVESVAWATERKDVLFTFFYLLSLLSYLGGQVKNWPRLKILLLTGLFFVLSLLSKPAAFTLPLILLLLDFYRNGSLSWKNVAEKIPFFLLSGITMFIALSGNATPYDADFYQLETYNLLERFFLTGYALLLYLSKIILPLNLSVYYPYPDRIYCLPFLVWMAPGIIGVIFILLNKHCAFKKELWFGVAFFLLTIVVNLPLLPVGQTIIADRFTYLPILGLCYFVSLALLKMVENKFKLAAVLVAGIVLVFSALTWQRTLVWRDSGTLWTDVLAKYPKVAMASFNRANFFAGNGQIELALKDYSRTIESSPLFFSAYNNRGNMFLLAGNYEAAFSDYNQTLKLNPAKTEAYSNRAMYYIIKQNYPAALLDLDKALSLQPQNPLIQEQRQKVLAKIAETK